MLRSLHPGVVLGAIAAVSFGVGIALEPMFESPAQASIPVRSAKLLSVTPAAIKPAPPVPETAAAAPIAKPAPEADPAVPAEPPASIVEGTDAEKNVDFVEMKDLPARQGEDSIEPGRDVNMLDEPTGGIDIPAATNAAAPDSGATANPASPHG